MCRFRWSFYSFLSQHRPERNWRFCFAPVTSCMVYFFSRKYLCVVMKDVKLLAVLESPRTISHSMWIVTWPHFGTCFQGWIRYNIVQKWGNQARAAGRHDQRDRAQSSNCQAVRNGWNPLHSATNALHSSSSLFKGYDNSHSPGMPQRPEKDVK